MPTLLSLVFGLSIAAPQVQQSSNYSSQDQIRSTSPDEPRDESEEPTFDLVAYHNQLEGLWLGEVIANWTGLRTEGLVNQAPFLTDADWGTDLGKGPIEFVLDYDPWPADDDTDIEYVYLHLMGQHGPLLGADEIRAGWIAHINHHIWVSNLQARILMGQGAQPPVSGMHAANSKGLMIDAQLTTELFGALAPGRPALALQLSELPIRTASNGYASHAAQFMVLLYSMACEVDTELPLEDQLVDLVQRARQFLPKTSKSSDVIDFVLADYLANPDPTDWELTRDRVYERYQLNAEQHGFQYQGWFESSVNLGATVTALLYGGGDYRRTLQIGTLAGWDSDNPTSTLGGLLGLIWGADHLRAEFPEHELSSRYRIVETRDNLPDYLPKDRAAQDNLGMMADRSLDVVRQVCLQFGGEVQSADLVVLPPKQPEGLEANPLVTEYLRSANNQILAYGGQSYATTSVDHTGAPEPENTSAAFFADANEANALGLELHIQPNYYSSETEPLTPGPHQMTVRYDHPQWVNRIRVIEGPKSGSFSSFGFEILVEGTWIPAPLDHAVANSQLTSTQGYQLLDFTLDQPALIWGLRATGTPGATGFGTLLELDGISD